MTTMKSTKDDFVIITPLGRFPSWKSAARRVGRSIGELEYLMTTDPSNYRVIYKDQKDD